MQTLEERCTHTKYKVSKNVNKVNSSETSSKREACFNRSERMGGVKYFGKTELDFTVLQDSFSRF